MFLPIVCRYQGSPQQASRISSLWGVVIYLERRYDDPTQSRRRRRSQAATQDSPLLVTAALIGIMTISTRLSWDSGRGEVDGEEGKQKGRGNRR
jgi:hypothetical protein